MDNTSGIRFAAKINKEYISAFGPETEFGILLAPTDYVESAGEMTVEALEALEIEGSKYILIKAEKFRNNSLENGNFFEFTSALIKLKPSNYNRAFSARIYVKSDSFYTYGNYSAENNSRKISDVSAKALADISETFVPNEYQYALGDGRYSPYTEAQRTILSSFIVE